MKKLTRYEIGFLEGVIDSDGCLTSYRLKPNKSETHRRNRQSFKLRLSIANNSIELLNKIQDIIGESGSIVVKHDNRYKTTSYELKYSHTVLRWLLPQLRLVVKEDRRVIFIQVLELIKQSNRFANSDIDDRHSKIEQLLDEVGL